MKQLLFSSPCACVLMLAALHGQTVIDDFNDNDRDRSIWRDPVVGEDHNGELLEVNGRIEFRSEASSEGDVRQELVYRAGYDAFWQARMVVAVDEASITNAGDLALMSIGVTKDGEGEAYLDVGYVCGLIDEIPAGKEAVFAYGSDDANQDGSVTVNATDLPEAIAVRMAYDPFTRTIRTYYDLNAGQTGGEWTLLETFSIDGSAVPGGKTLDWGMSSESQFIIELNGGSEGGVAVAAGSAWVDDVVVSRGRTIHRATTSDDFNDNVRDESVWNAPGGDAQLAETNGRLEFSGTSGVENEAWQSLAVLPLYDEAWQVQTRVAIDSTIFTSVGQDGSMSLDIGNTSAGENEYAWIGYGAGVLPGVDENQAIFAGGVDDSLEEEFEVLDVRALPDTVGLRITYDPNLRLLRTYYSTDAVLADDQWQLFRAFTIDGSSVPGAESFDWGMGAADRFFIDINGHSTNAVIAAGKIWADDFRCNLGTSAHADGGNVLQDDFNDDHLEPLSSGLWQEPEVELGSPVFRDTDHRRELIVADGSGEQEIRQAVGPQFHPVYSRPFEMRVEMHCQPAGLNADGDVAAMEVEITAGNGDGAHVLFSAGALHNGTSVDEVFAISNSAVLPPDDEPDLFGVVDQPEVVGLRVSWNPDTQVLSFHVDTDGDRAVETWTLYADYSLDGSDRGAAFISDWGMGPDDVFVISLNGFCENAAVGPGEAYFDNFQLFSMPAPTGYDLWAEDIPDGGMRGELDDASGNGIPNVLQYMYGLEALSTETDVLPSIELVNGRPVLTHGHRGFADPAPDYVFDYQQSTTLGAGSWSSSAAWESVEEIESDGRFFLRITFPKDSPARFYRLSLLSIE